MFIFCLVRIWISKQALCGLRLTAACLPGPVTQRLAPTVHQPLWVQAAFCGARGGGGSYRGGAQPLTKTGRWTARARNISMGVS